MDDKKALDWFYQVLLKYQSGRFYESCISHPASMLGRYGCFVAHPQSSQPVLRVWKAVAAFK